MRKRLLVHQNTPLCRLTAVVYRRRGSVAAPLSRSNCGTPFGGTHPAGTFARRGTVAKQAAAEWSIAQVSSHLGSQADIFGHFLQAGLTGSAAPGADVFAPIWDKWNALAPLDQVTQSMAVNGEFVTRLEQLPADVRATFALSLFGIQLDLAGLGSLRLGEHALHTWDVAVALDPHAVLPGDVVELLVDNLEQTAARASNAQEGVGPVQIATTSPERRFQLELHPNVVLAPHPTDSETADGDADLRIPAEALIRLVYGRLDPDHTPAGLAGDGRLDRLRFAFPGF